MAYQFESLFVLFAFLYFASDIKTFHIKSVDVPDNRINLFAYDLLLFLAIFRNKITTILTQPTSEGGEWGEVGVVKFSVLRAPIADPQC